MLAASTDLDDHTHAAYRIRCESGVGQETTESFTSVAIARVWMQNTHSSRAAFEGHHSS